MRVRTHHTHTHTHTHTHIHTRIHTHIHTRTSTHAHTHTHPHTCPRTHTHEEMGRLGRTHAHTHTHANTQLYMHPHPYCTFMNECMVSTCSVTHRGGAWLQGYECIITRDSQDTYSVCTKHCHLNTCCTAKCHWPGSTLQLYYKKCSTNTRAVRH